MSENTSENIQKPEGSWWNNLISVILIVFLIVTGVFAFNRNSDPAEETSSDQEVAEKIDEIEADKQDSEQKDDTPEEKNTASEQATDTPSDTNTTPSIVKNTERIEVYAVAGDGVTHLARKAIQQYLEDNDISLSKEQKLYAETVLKNIHKDSHPGLSIGDSVSFDMTSLSDTIEKAQNLSESQTKAWSQYTHLVPSL